ncbi:protein LNK2 isoform X1 [Quercus suber]|uniref:protein LNK2 isoform X1 n=2 Tax=Quercus suber TaxID=58331 RepID=UPI000CE18726|nr:protein LNK2 isoform X1 [Quercus suber]XP_023879321.1 protein LNK2 isoform X1 [Quercus suber]XP_023879322.1 protein LNK2 isoform X1 [Quercus suber]
MFDWNEEELANIIWGEADESGDHIVPYPEASEDYRKKEWTQEAATNKPTEQRTAGAKTHLHGIKLESSSNHETNGEISTSGFSVDSWPHFSLSNAVKAEQDSMGTGVSNNLTEISTYNSTRETDQLDKDAEIFENTDEGKEQGDLVDYGWANIGSFDDLDRIFSNDDPIFGHANLGNDDELWPSSKDVNSPVKTFPISVGLPNLGSGELRNASEKMEIKTEYVQQDDDQPFSIDYGKLKDPALHGMQNAHAILDHVECAGDKINTMAKEQTDMDMVGKTSAVTFHPAAENVVTTNAFTDKATRQKKLLKSRRKPEKSKVKALPHLYGTWSPSGNPSRQFENQLAPSMLQSPPSSMLSHQRQLPGPESLQYQHMTNLFVAPSAYGNLTNPYPAMPVLSHVQSAERKHQPLLPGYEGSAGEANPISNSENAHVKPLIMTPQEKIEKLRRRQQMRAMLAIQKQQQQFNHQVPSVNHSFTQKSTQESQTLPFEGADLEVEDISNFPALDPNSPLEQDDSNTVSVAVDDYSAEETVLFRLQDVISKLDMKLRLCIRDSLFRLAQSAMQRRYAGDTFSTNKSSRDEHEVMGQEDINSRNRNPGMPDIETETNPIDRTVAHLLFHRPLELPGKLSDTPESPISTKLPCEHKVVGSLNLTMGCLPESTKSKQNFPHQGPKNSYPLPEPQNVDQFKNSPCMDTSENASNNEPADDGARDVGASK